MARRAWTTTIRLALALLALLCAAPTAAAEDMDMHNRTYSFTRLTGEYGADTLNWDAEGWIGGDTHKFWWKTEGEHRSGNTERAEFQALYSRNVWAFFDVQGGIRQDLAPGKPTFAVFGVQGLAPYLLETELHAYVATAGDVHIRARQSFDILLTNRFILTPTAEADLYLSNVPDRQIASGFSRIETGVQARYEINRKFAPTLSLIYDSNLGGTRRLAEAAGEDPGGWRLSAGLRIWF